MPHNCHSWSAGSLCVSTAVPDLMVGLLINNYGQLGAAAPLFFFAEANKSNQSVSFVSPSVWSKENLGSRCAKAASHSG